MQSNKTKIQNISPNAKNLILKNKKILNITSNNQTTKEKLNNEIGLKIAFDNLKNEKKDNNDNNNDDNQLNVILNMWEYLGVSETYKTIFLNIYKSLDMSTKEDYMKYEIDSLKKINDILGVIKYNITNFQQKIGVEIQSRNKCLLTLKKLIKNLGFVENKKEKQEIIKETSDNLKSLRIISLNVVVYFMKFWESCSYQILNGKYHLEKINKMYSFDRNYLIKVNYSC